MSTEENKNQYRRYIDAWNDGTILEILEDVIASDVVYRSASASEPLRGIDNARAIVAGTAAALQDIHLTLDDLVAEGNTVAGRITIRAIHAGDFMGIPATGKEIAMADVGIVRFEGGKMVDIWEMGDSLGVLQQLGAAPVPQTVGT